MKKLLFCATLAVAIVFAGCGKKSSLKSLPEELRVEVEKADREIKDGLAKAERDGDLAELKQYGVEFIYEGIEVEDHDIVFSLRLDGSIFELVSLKDVAEQEGLTQQKFEQALRSGELQNSLEMEDQRVISLLKEHRYNIALRIKGKQDGDELYFKVPYQHLPDVDASSSATERYDNNNYGYAGDELDRWISEFEVACAEGDMDAVMRVSNKIDSKYDEDDLTPSQMRRIEAAAALLYGDVYDDDLLDVLDGDAYAY